MNNDIFTIKFPYHDQWITAEIRPCCQVNNVVDYAVWINDKLLFTITRNKEVSGNWVVALQNSDDNFDPQMVQTIGNEIALQVATADR